MDSLKQRGVVEWLLYTYKEDPNGDVAVQDLYNKYVKDIGVHLEFEGPASKKKLGSIIGKLFPNVVSVTKKSLKRQIYRGLSEIPENRENDIPITDIGKMISVPPVTKLGFFAMHNTPQSNSVFWGYLHHLKINNTPVLTEMCINQNGEVTLTTMGKKLDVNCLGIGTVLKFTKLHIVSYLSAVSKLMFCHGYDKNYCPGSSKVIRETWTSLETDKVVYRSINCTRVIPPVSQKRICSRCQQQHYDFSRGRKTLDATKKDLRTDLSENSSSSTVTVSDEPADPPTPSQVVEVISNQIDRLFPDHSIQTEGLKILIGTQVTNLHQSDKRRHRWHPRIIRLCLLLWGRSPQAYQDLCSSGFLVLPTTRLLQYYKNCVEQKAGLQEKMFCWMKAEADRMNVSEIGREGGLLLDEMAIQEDLHMQNTSGQFKLHGFADLGDVNEAMEMLKTGKQEAKLATHVLQLVFLGDNGFRFPFAHFPCTEASSSDLFHIVWEAIGTLRDYTFKVNYISMDGASTNRSFMKIHFQDSSTDGMRAANFAVLNPMPPNDKIIFLMDPSSGVGETYKRNLLVNGYRVQWRSWVSAYHWDVATNPMRIHQKLTEDHMFPDNNQKMRNHLAEQVLDSDMLYLMQSYQRSLSAVEAEQLTSVVEFLKHTSAMLQIFRDFRPIYRIEDVRISTLLSVHKWFVDWEVAVKKSYSNIPTTHKSEVEQRRRHMMSDQTREDISSAILGLRELCNVKIVRPHPGSIVPGHVNTDVVENVFCQQRGIYHGNGTNPNYYSYSTGINAVVLGQSSASRKRSSNCGTKAADPSPISLNVSLRKRPKKYFPRL